LFICLQDVDEDADLPIVTDGPAHTLPRGLDAEAPV
jgi:hypothetical protein